jgi:hypothetical protein
MRAYECGRFTWWVPLAKNMSVMQRRSIMSPGIADALTVFK